MIRKVKSRLERFSARARKEHAGKTGPVFSKRESELYEIACLAVVVMESNAFTVMEARKSLLRATK